MGREGKLPENGSARTAKRSGGSATRKIGSAASQEEIDALLAGHCRQAVTLLPRGVLGVATAIEFLGVLPAAVRLGLPDVTESGPRLFALLVAHGLLAAMPSPRVVPAALGLVAGVSPLLEARSARQWTLWVGLVREPGSRVVAALRERTPASQISLAPPMATTVRPLRAAALRADRDRLAAELVTVAGERTRALEQADRERARADELARTVELAGKSGRKELRDEFKKLLAAVQQAVGVGDDDTRTIQELIVHVFQQRREQTTRAEKAEQGLHRVLADLAAAGEKIAAIEQEVAGLETELDGAEVELWMAAAEISLRKSRMLRPDQSEVDAYRRSGAADARRAQQQRRESVDE